ncbi:MAG: BamA/OMP85 family outer membrane protein, partial [Vicinamibacterales bacterium]
MSAWRRLLPILFSVAAVSIGACREGDVQIANLDFNGVEQVDERALERALQTREGSWVPWGRKRYFDRRAFDADLKRIEAFYRDRGFPDARVTSVDVAFNDAQDNVSITVTIAEGEPIRVAAVELAGFDVLPEDDRRRLEDSLELQAGAPLDRLLVRTTRERALNELRDHGYPFADVTITEDDVGARQRRLTVQAVPKTLASFGDIDIVGHASVSEETIRRQLTFDTGDVYSLRAMRDSQRRLYGLELFEFVNVESREDETPGSPEVPVRVTLAEGKQQRVTFGAGYGSEEKGRARIRWDHVNARGSAEHAGFEAKWSSLDRGARAEYRKPYFLMRNLSLNFEGEAWQTAEPVYTLDSFGGRVTLRHQMNAQNAWSISFSDEYQRSSVTPEALEDLSIRDELIALGLDPTDGELTGTLSLINVEASRSTADSLLDARSGYVLNASVQQAGQWLPGTFNFWSATGEARHYLPVRRALVLANRLRAGTIAGLGDRELNVPFYKRYFLGGSTNIRGWGRFEVGPTSALGLPIGGLSMLEASSEVRVPLSGTIAAVIFLDVGNAWLQSWDFNLNDMRYAV